MNLRKLPFLKESNLIHMMIKTCLGLICLGLVLPASILSISAEESPIIDSELYEKKKPAEDKKPKKQPEQTETDHSNFTISKFYLDGRYGIDSNPHALADELDPETEDFLYGDFHFSANYAERVYLQSSANKSWYLDDDRADKFDADLQLSYEDYFNLGGRWDYQIMLAQSLVDETFVNKANGLVTEFNGESIADRFDYSQSSYALSLGYNLGHYAKFNIDFAAISKDYENFSIAGLSNLDYDENKVAFGVDFFTSEDSYYFGKLEFAFRDYLDRRAKDLLGQDIADSDLRFNFIDVKVGYILEIDKDTLWRASFGYGRREDNGDGYWSSYHTFLKFDTEQVFYTYYIFSAALIVEKYAYDPPFDIALSFQDEPFWEKEGASLSVEYEWVFATFFKTRIGIYAELKAQSYVSDTPQAIFDRYQAASGIRWTIF